ncbi:PSP1 domain-containing protein [Thermosediminibacter oceani]|uniref:PSP1 domain protein n=1 Tax=Thermosediminibacter oceani (strain ATCC BAA-1034 / DSM 16646 / JW/IW-1228P) TaxID=555079 RepID=D9RYY4_THEOJ|nr:stage 0 sporulation family protein [Thermosediminibacter oceani]ADL06812.1 PSP1 domain protein [Thermosediminibacter oceani DSM 16646]
MVKVVGVRFKRAGKIYYFNPGTIELSVGDKVIVETARGIEYGEVVIGPKDVREEDVITPLKDVIRKATPEDKMVAEENRVKAREAADIAVKKIQEHGLEMKLVDVEYTFDRSKLIFYFTADGRVDFRELVKDLASIFRTRIELRQIGVRDEAKMVGGLGPCGRVACCHTFLGEFDPVSIKMAKQQNLSLNPGKISGLCGRLMCCLRFEYDGYCEAAKCCESCKEAGGLPEVDSEVITPDGEGTVVSVNKDKGAVTVRLAENGEKKEFPAEEVELKGS